MFKKKAKFIDFAELLDNYLSDSLEESIETFYLAKMTHSKL